MAKHKKTADSQSLESIVSALDDAYVPPKSTRAAMHEARVDLPAYFIGRAALGSEAFVSQVRDRSLSPLHADGALVLPVFKVAEPRVEVMRRLLSVARRYRQHGSLQSIEAVTVTQLAVRGKSVKRLDMICDDPAANNRLREEHSWLMARKKDWRLPGEVQQVSCRSINVTGFDYVKEAVDIKYELLPYMPSHVTLAPIALYHVNADKTELDLV